MALSMKLSIKQATLTTQNTSFSTFRNLCRITSDGLIHPYLIPIFVNCRTKAHMSVKNFDLRELSLGPYPFIPTNHADPNEVRNDSREIPVKASLSLKKKLI